MDLLTKVWNFFNGKKTFLGLAAYALYYAGAGFGWYRLDPTAVAWIATWTGAGLVHKFFKA